MEAAYENIETAQQAALTPPAEHGAKVSSSAPSDTRDLDASLEELQEQEMNSGASSWNLGGLPSADRMQDCGGGAYDTRRRRQSPARGKRPASGPKARCERRRSAGETPGCSATPRFDDASELQKYRYFVEVKSLHDGRTVSAKMPRLLLRAYVSPASASTGTPSTRGSAYHGEYQRLFRTEQQRPRPPRRCRPVSCALSR